MALWITIGYKAQRVAFYMLLTEDQVLMLGENFDQLKASSMMSFIPGGS
jgi:hypothetical protein